MFFLCFLTFFFLSSIIQSLACASLLQRPPVNGRDNTRVEPINWTGYLMFFSSIYFRWHENSIFKENAGLQETGIFMFYCASESYGKVLSFYSLFSPPYWQQWTASCDCCMSTHSVLKIRNCHWEVHYFWVYWYLFCVVFKIFLNYMRSHLAMKCCHKYKIYKEP